MVYTPQILIPAQTAAYTTKSFTALASDTVSFVTADLGAGETVTVQIWAAAAATPKWINYLIGGTQQQSDMNNPVLELSFNDSLVCRLVKSVTALAVGVAVTPNIEIGVLPNGN